MIHDRGDIGHVDRSGYLYVTGRMKELIVTAGGDNILPVPLEQKILVITLRRLLLLFFNIFETGPDPDPQQCNGGGRKAQVPHCARHNQNTC